MTTFLESLNAEDRKAYAACTAKHTKYQPTTEEFCCPRCEAPAGDFCVEESPNYDCPALHEEDSLVCHGKKGKGCPAEHGTSGKAFAAMLVKRKNLVPCPHCKGTGLIAATPTQRTP